MAHIIVRNSLSNLKAAKLNVNLPKYVSTESNGDPIWLMEISTTYPSASGTDIKPIYTNKLGSFENLDDAVADSVAQIASQIEWTPLVTDNTAPYVNEYKPIGESVSIASNVFISIKDDIPAAGIDISGIKIIINNDTVDIDITADCEIGGDPFEYNVCWKPPYRLTRHYEE